MSTSLITPDYQRKAMKTYYKNNAEKLRTSRVMKYLEERVEKWLNEWDYCFFKHTSHKSHETHKKHKPHTRPNRRKKAESFCPRCGNYEQ